MPRPFIAALAVALAATPLAAQRCPWGGTTRCFIPLDIAQGPMLDAGTPTPYTFAARINPAVGIGDGGTLRIGPAAAVSYANPDWTVAGGARASLRLLRFGLPHWGLFAGAEQLWGTHGTRPGAASLVINAGAVRAGGWVVRDWDRKTTSVQLSLGTDLSVLVPLLFPSKEKDPFASTGGAR
jgi:hypothetical protein